LMSQQPTTDLYFRTAMARHITARWPASLWRKAPIRAVGQNSFIAGEWFILVRRDKPRLMREALAWGGRLAYVIDDDVSGGMACPELPPAYRAKLAAFERSYHRDLLARADAVLAASDTLVTALTASAQAARRLGPRLARIDPVWHQPLADQAHFAALEQPTTLRIVQLGTGSHRGALSAIAPLMAEVLERQPLTSFTYFSARAIDAALEKHPRARRLDPMTWREYQRWMARQRFHLALYPLAQTPFDRARSASKITEHAILGAAALYPESWQPAQDAIAQSAALPAPDDPAQWRDAITAAIAQRAALGKIAERAAQRLACQHPAAVQQALWGSLLELDI
jgi:hypothetical protein